ncbi:MAG TPA: SDR family oxidoreductase [Aestuariivirgaceae bacterium]|jgi:NAD(P)-dependent dehydrogenase (short-subunit alcohol dehydrogenase family)
MSPTTLITGASRGIGRNIAERLASAGHEIINLSRNRPKDNFPGVTYTVDLADADAAKQTLTDVTANYSIDNLVNNAAMIEVGTLEQIDLADVDRMLDLNIRAAILTMQAVLPAMKAKRRGRVVNIGSRAALGKTGRTVYAATKAALAAMTRTWALELAKDGITVNTVAPGPIATQMLHDSSPADDPATKAFLAAIPIGRVGKPADVAAAVAFFVSEDASYITGQTLYVCGGLSILSSPL